MWLPGGVQLVTSGNKTLIHSGVANARPYGAGYICTMERAVTISWFSKFLLHNGSGGKKTDAADVLVDEHL